MPNGQVQARIQFLCFLSLFLLVCCSRPQRQHQPSSFFYHLHPTPTGVLLTWMEPEPLLSLRDAHVIYYDMYIIHMMQRQFNLASLETYLILRLYPAGLSHLGRDGCAWADLSRAQRSCRRYRGQSWALHAPPVPVRSALPLKPPASVNSALPLTLPAKIPQLRSQSTSSVAPLLSQPCEQGKRPFSLLDFRCLLLCEMPAASPKPPQAL